MSLGLCCMCSPGLPVLGTNMMVVSECGVVSERVAMYADTKNLDYVVCLLFLKRPRRFFYFVFVVGNVEA